jgi:hypothetical protein
MNNDELIALVEAEEANCLSSNSGTLAEQRRKAMAYYLGQPYGNEVEGRSQVVTTEVKDAVEDIMPALMKIFTASGEVVRCDPKSEGDEEGAQQATDYLHHVFWEQNAGFLTLYCLFKDALLQKNGYAKAYWEDYEDQGKETYEGLNDLEFQVLGADPELELIEHSAEPDEDPAAMEQAMQMQLPAPMKHNATFRRSKKYGKTCIDPCPPEEILISRETPNQLEKARFVEHRTLKTISDIRKMGYDIDDDIADHSSADDSLERIERLKFDDALADKPDEGLSDPSTRRVWFCEAYLNVDFDGDGIAEFRKISKVGKTILDNEEFDSLPVIGGTAVLMPHKHYGLSLYDLVGDIQLIKSTVTRQLLDNAYVANNGRMAVLDGMVNMDDLLTARPNGVVRMKTMGALTRIDQPVLGQSFYNLLEYFDKVKQQRTGSTGFPNAVNPDAINAKAAFVDQYAEASMERIALMARILAETVVKPLFWKILELESKHQNKPKMVRLRNKWVQVDPRGWKNRYDLTINVGLGTGSQTTTLNGAMGIMQIQSGLMQAGLAGRVVTEKNFFNAARKYAQAVFPKDADSFFTDPTGMPPPQPGPDPEMLKIELAKYKADMGDAQKRDKMALDAELEQLRQMMEADKVQFQAMVDKADQERSHQAELIKMAVESDQADRQRVVEALTQIRVATEQANAEQANIQIKGAVDSLLSAQEHHQTKMEQILQAQADAALIEKEIVRDEKTGKATGVRPKKK